MNATPPSSNAPAPGAAPPGGGSAQESQRIWTEAFRAFDALYELPAPQRAAALDELRAADPAVADAVQGLLAEHDAQSEPPEGAPQDPEATQRRPDARGDALREGLRTLPRGGAEPLPEAAPETIGPWRLLRELGRGGTARVWLARREDVPWLREVALKVPLMGVYRDDLRERLVRERDILSRLEHPHIARLYDAGFAEAQPWLAIEYVQGQDILAWCDARTLGLRERVALFRQVLQAVQYAHAALIVHRDLKPENILVTADGSVRLLDFGIAKLIAEGASHTETTQLTHLAGRMLTPAYASPEQLRDEPLTTATDIYSLGVVLYQLLTGVHPAVGAGARSIQQVERAVTEGRLALASRSGLKTEAAQARGLALKALKRSLSGDLEAILAKALNLEPAQRYETAAAFDAELEAWLDGRPVRARKPGWLQLTAKLVRRHPVASALGAAAVVALSATTVIAVTQAREARLQAQQARTEADRARASKDFVLGLFAAADPDRNGGKDVLARDLLTHGEQRVERDLDKQPALQAEMLAAIGRIWWNFGDMDNAARVLQRRTSVANEALGPAERVQALLDQAQVAREAYRFREASTLVEQARVAIADVPVQGVDQIRSRLHLELGFAALERGDFARAAAEAEHSAALTGAAGDWLDALGASHLLTLALRKSGRHDEAVAVADKAMLLARRAAARVEEQGGAMHGAESGQALLNSLRLERLRSLWALGSYRVGWRDMDDLMRDMERLLGANAHEYALSYRQLWLAWLVRTQDGDTAERWVRAHPGEYAELAISNPVSALERDRWLGRLWMLQGRWDLARDAVDRGLRASEGPASAGRLHMLLVAAELALRTGLLDQAASHLSEAEALEAHGHAGFEAPVEIRSLRGALLARRGAWTQADNVMRESVTLAQRSFGASHPAVARARLNRIVQWMQRPGGSPPWESLRSDLALAEPVIASAYERGSVMAELTRRLATTLADSRDASKPGPRGAPFGAPSGTFPPLVI